MKIDYQEVIWASLNDPVPRAFWLAFEFLLLTFVLGGCSHGIHSGTGGWPATPSPTPEPISSSAQVVRLSTQYMPRSSSTTADVALVISPGFHINANPATFPYLIATEVQTGKAEGIRVSGKPVYPPPILKKFPFAEKPLAVYEGQVVINLMLTIAWNAKGPRALPIKVRVQACDNEKCYPPATLDDSISIDLDLPRP